MNKSPSPPNASPKDLAQAWLEECCALGWAGDPHDDYGAFEWCLQHNISLAQRALDTQARQSFFLSGIEGDSPHPLVSVHAHQPNLLPQAIQKYGPQQSAIVFLDLLVDLNCVVSRNLPDDIQKQKRRLADFVHFGVDLDDIHFKPGSAHKMSFLFYALTHEFTWETIQTLMELGSDIHEKDDDGDTALHASLSSGNSNVLEILALGVDPNIQNNYGDTALHLACLKFHPPRSDGLIEMLWDLTTQVKNTAGQAPSDILFDKNQALWYKITSRESKQGLISEMDPTNPKPSLVKKM